MMAAWQQPLGRPCVCPSIHHQSSQLHKNQHNSFTVLCRCMRTMAVWRQPLGRPCLCPSTSSQAQMASLVRIGILLPTLLCYYVHACDLLCHIYASLSFNLITGPDSIRLLLCTLLHFLLANLHLCTPANLLQCLPDDAPTNTHTHMQNAHTYIEQTNNTLQG